MDYYKTLGVSKNASSDDIKKAYKKLAMKHHPDKGGDSETFARINEAYETLKDPQKRSVYDNPQPQYQFNTGNMPHGFEDMFAQFGFGRRQAKNKDMRLQVIIEFEEQWTGKPITASYRLMSGRNETVDIRIPPGVTHNETIRYAGLGDDSIPNIQRGNLLVHVQVRPHAYYKRDGDNIIATKMVDIFDLLLGTNITVDSPTGRSFSLKIPRGTNPGTTFSINGHGIPNVRSGRQGNIYVKIDAKIPVIDDAKVLNSLQKIRSRLTNSIDN